MENEQPIRHCRNCNAPLPEHAVYCPQCSQKDHDGRYSFSEMMAELFTTVLNIDSIAIRTARALAIPGKLTQDYFDGKHIRYYRPIKLFFYTGALLLAMISVKVSKSKSQWLPEAYHEKKELHQKHLFYLRMDSLKQATAKTFNNRSALAAMDTLLAKMDSSYIRSDNDSLNFIRSFINVGKKDTLVTKPGVKVTADASKKVRIALDDVENMEEDSLLAKYKIIGFWEKVFVRQQIRVSKNGDNFMPFLISNTLWMMLVMMPLLALVLKLLYVRRDYFYFEHLIFSFHVHSFMFLFTAILLFFSKWMEEWAGPVVSLSLLVTGIYPLIAMKRFYRQGWMKTTAKYFISNFLYFILSAFAVMLLAFASFVLF